MNNPILRVHKKLLNKQPPQVARLEFINSLFEGYDGWEILIDLRCRKFTEDLVYQKKMQMAQKISQRLQTLNLA